jgi:hypothetical protein
MLIDYHNAHINFFPAPQVSQTYSSIAYHVRINPVEREGNEIEGLWCFASED